MSIVCLLGIGGGLIPTFEMEMDEQTTEVYIQLLLTTLSTYSVATQLQSYDLLNYWPTTNFFILYLLLMV